MLTTARTISRMLAQVRRPFGEQAKAALPSFLSAQEIKEKLTPEEYGKLQEKLELQEKEALDVHRTRLAALQKLLTA